MNTLPQHYPPLRLADQEASEATSGTDPLLGGGTRAFTDVHWSRDYFADSGGESGQRVNKTTITPDTTATRTGSRKYL